MNSSKIPVSIIIPIRNEAANLPRCLASVAWADEVFVVDSQSTDGSIGIATHAGANVVQFHFNGIWPKKKNWALENLPFRHEWVFILDADEVLPPETGPEIAALIARDGAGQAGFWINRRFMFMGGWLRHAYYPNWNLRFFRHRCGRYEQLVRGDTQSGDNEVHEHILVDGSTGHLRTEMDHYAFPRSMSSSRNTTGTPTGRPGWSSRTACAFPAASCRRPRPGGGAGSSAGPAGCRFVRCSAFFTCT